MADILLVEDEEIISEALTAYLERAGYTVHLASDGQEAWEFFKEKQAQLSLVVLDLNLPIMDGIQVCRLIRRQSLLPIIMLTARSSERDEIIGLEEGADDYVRKPFSPPVVLARIKTLLRRHEPTTVNQGEVAIDTEKMQVSINEKIIPLTTTQFNILLAMIRHPGRFFTRNELLEKAHPHDLSEASDRVIDAHIKLIRKALGDNPQDPKFIITVIGAGYKWNDKLATAP